MPHESLSSDPGFLAAYGRVVEELRVELRLDRKELAELAGISYSYLSAIESGQKMPSPSVQQRLADALGVSMQSILARANDAMMQEQHPIERILARDYDEFPAMTPMVRPSTVAPSPSVEEWISPSGALAELRALLPQLSPQDAALVVSMARRLAGEVSPRDTRARERRYRGARGRESRTEAYLRFWTMYLGALDERGLDWARGRRPEPRSYFTTPSPISGTSFSASFARNRLLRHELYINRGSRTANIELLRELESRRADIEEAYGLPLEFEDPGRERRAVRIAEYRDGHVSRTEEYEEYVDWFIDRGIRLRKGIDAFLA